MSQQIKTALWIQTTSISYRQNDLSGSAAAHSTYAQDICRGIRQSCLSCPVLRVPSSGWTGRTHQRKPSLSRHVPPQAAEWSPGHRGSWMVSGQGMTPEDSRHILTDLVCGIDLLRPRMPSEMSRARQLPDQS